MTQSKLHQQKKVKNYIVFSLLMVLVIFIFSLAMIKISAAMKQKSQVENEKN